MDSSTKFTFTVSVQAYEITPSGYVEAGYIQERAVS